MSKTDMTGHPKILNTWESMHMNNWQYRMYYEMIEQMACAIYRWEGVPVEIDERFLELTLFNRGLSVFFHDDEYDKYFSLMGAPSGSINMYQNPTSYIAYGTNGFRRNLSMFDCVPIWNNYLRRPDINAMRIYARRLADIDRTVDVNLYAQKTPILLVVPESMRLTAQNLVKQYSGNEPVIMGNEGLFDPSAFTYLSPEAPYLVDKLLEAKMTVWSEVMTYFGIQNTNIQKSERVQSAEVNANNGQIEANRLIRIKCRRMACKEINRRYGLEMWCDMDKDVSSMNENMLLMATPADTVESTTELF
jgi:hypothetical protein